MNPSLTILEPKITLILLPVLLLELFTVFNNDFISFLLLLPVSSVNLSESLNSEVTFTFVNLEYLYNLDSNKENKIIPLCSIELKWILFYHLFSIA